METNSDTKEVITEEIIDLNNSLINKKYSKDSFERFGDDLCELVLSYMTFSGKIQFENISKQWQRLIYNKEHEIEIKDHEKQFYVNSYPIPKTYVKVFLNKFQFITNISIYKTDLKELSSSINLLFHIMSGYKCLKSIKIAITLIDRDILYKIAFLFLIYKFITNCGQNLRDININGLTDEEMVTVLRLTPNVRITALNGNIRAFIDQHLPKLTQINHFEVKDLDHFKSFTDLYHKQIKKISFARNSRDINTKAIMQLIRFEKLETLNLFLILITDNMLKILSQLKSLTKLSIQSKEITTDGVLYLINKSSDKLRDIYVDKDFIDEKTITAFVNKANKSPKIKYRFNDIFSIINNYDSKIWLINNKSFNNNLYIKIRA